MTDSQELPAEGRARAEAYRQGWNDCARDAADRLRANPPVQAVTTDEVGRWHRGRFGRLASIELAMGKLAEETGEVCGAIVKRAEGAVRPAKGLVTYEDWTRHLHEEIGDVGIVLHNICVREGVDLDELIARRFRDDVALRTDQERPAALAVGDLVRTIEQLDALPVGTRLAIRYIPGLTTRRNDGTWDPVPYGNIAVAAEDGSDAVCVAALPETPGEVPR